MARLHRVSILQRGYRRRQVDHAVSVLEDALTVGRPPRAAEVRRLGFDLVRRGYEPVAVDRMMDRYEQRCVESELASAPGSVSQIGDELMRDVELLHARLSAAPGARFDRVAALRHGYALQDVDALVDRCLDGLGSHLSGAQNPSADDVRLTSFGRARGGYAEEAVDATFDEVIDLLLRQAALRVAAGNPYAPAVGAEGSEAIADSVQAPAGPGAEVAEPSREVPAHIALAPEPNFGPGSADAVTMAHSLNLSGPRATPPGATNSAPPAGQQTP